MPIEELTIIGEELNYSLRRIQPLMNSAYETRDFKEIKEIALTQEERGAKYLDINIGTLPADMMGLIVEGVRGMTLSTPARPVRLSIWTSLGCSQSWAIST